MKRLALGTLVVLLTLVAIASPASAQRRRMQGGRAVRARTPEVGPHIGYNFDAKEFLLGAQLSYPIMPQLDFYPTFDFYTVSGGTLWQVNFDVRGRPLRAPYQFWYAGGGLNVIHASAGGFGNTDTNLNLLAGFEGQARSFRPYGEARLTLGNGSAFQVVGGLSFPLH